MKKFIKTIALTTVMCLILSTVAFAAGSVTADTTTKKVEITVKDVKQGEQVAIILTTDAATEFTTDTILFIDQKVATADSVVFEAEVTDTSVNAIDVFAGYASNESSEAVQVGNDIPITAETKLELIDALVVDDITKADGYNEDEMAKVNEGTKGSVVWMQFNATNVAAGDLTKMYWAFHVTDLETNQQDTKYAIGDISGLGLGSVLSGDVQIAAAFDSTGYRVDSANAIFQLKGEDVHTAQGDKLTEIKGDKVEK